jgi:hypothetical protein
MAIASPFLGLRRTAAPNQFKSVVALAAILLTLPAAIAAPIFPLKHRGKDTITATLVETASYTPCRDGCSAATEPARAFCFKAGDQFTVAEGKSYLHENKFESMEDFAGKQLPIRLTGRWVWVTPPDRPAIKLRRGSSFEDFKDNGCIREVHRPILALAAHSRPRYKIPSTAIAIAGPGRGEFQPLYLWYQCSLDADAIACRRWYRNGQPTAADWYCAQSTDSTQTNTNANIDPLLSRTGRLVLASGDVLRQDARERVDGKLEKPNEACF